MDAKQKLDFLTRQAMEQQRKASVEAEKAQSMPKVESGSWQKNQKKFDSTVKKLGKTVPKGGN